MDSLDCFYCIILPALFCVIFIIVIILCFYLSKRFNLVKSATPYFCQTGAKKPAYYVFAPGLTICGMILIAISIIQYMNRNECYSNTKYDDIKYQIYNIVTMVTLIFCAVSLCGMGFVDMDRNYTLHLIFTAFMMIFANIYMPFSTLLTGFSNKINCINIRYVEIIIISKWCAFAYICLSTCIVYGFVTAANILKSKRKRLLKTDPTDKETIKLKQRIKCYWITGSLMQYSSIIAFVFHIAMLIPTQLL